MNFIKYTAILPNGLETTATLNKELVAQFLPFLNEAGELTHIQLLMNLPTDVSFETFPVKGKFDKNNKVIMDKRGNAEVTFQNKQVQKHVFIIIRKKEDMENALAAFDYNVSSYTFPEVVEPTVDEMIDATVEAVVNKLEEVS